MANLKFNQIVLTASWEPKDETFSTSLQMQCERAHPAQVGAAMRALQVQVIKSIEQMRGELSKLPEHLAAFERGMAAQQSPSLKKFESWLRELGNSR